MKPVSLPMIALKQAPGKSNAVSHQDMARVLGAKNNSSTLAHSSDSIHFSAKLMASSSTSQCN